MITKSDIFRAMVVKEENGTFTREITSRTISDLPKHGVLINVKYSSLNYKDVLSAKGNKGVTKNYPHTPGIDAAGVVVESNNAKFKPGDEVVVTGFDLGMNTSGGFASYIRVPAEWVLPRPKGLSLRECMIYGTAGLTAALSVGELEASGIDPTHGDVLVTGATGGVGSLSVAILHQAGYPVVASSGKPEAGDYLKKLGATSVIGRTEVDDPSDKALLKTRWAGVIDTVGGNTLATALKSTKPRGTVVATGMVGSAELKTTVFPFILRAINLLGVDSESCPMELRYSAWDRMGDRWKTKALDWVCTEISLDELNEYIDLMSEGKTKGRIIINLEL